MNLIMSLFVAYICFSLVLMNKNDSVDSSKIGLAIWQSFYLTSFLSHGIKVFIETMSLMTSVERILEYSSLPQEESITSENPPPSTWPSQGQLILKNVNMKYYREGPLVLKNLNISIEPGWKVGVVGRTGAGKSSLISALFRLFDEGLEGEIRLDGRDTNTVGFNKLRSKISIIPQESVLFSESLRYNLDPFNQYDDMKLWEVLRLGELNDVPTDTLIQNTIKKNFKECTVITVAHRLNTIIDSDQVIVMENGSIVEFGCPYELLYDKPNGYFSQMVEKTGNQMAQSLLQQAKKACESNNHHHEFNLSAQNIERNTIITEQSAL
ncbi:PREDICTED: probable multidrug resistance-associated protein lethal(2)03659 [Wasmannia auropunctata]|uniref:probable multidrug resistance-associated protein lethal(2)03659 n=1 Tax=Wasmannia auropunctata TaxID=64793 RepID=UPI0005EDC885|nr:PREDICTED: probable multidrug resistance-associated protein lethal(2)03659 [Wasmannia auropunctata]